MEDKSILNIDTRNKRLLIRADLNVPINNNKISDNTRIERFCSGISKLLKKNAKIRLFFFSIIEFIILVVSISLKSSIFIK